MKINVTLPFDNVEKADEFCTPEAVREIAQHIEKLGFNAGNVTDHPCPTARWRDSGGHDAQDPFVMLSLVAAHTTTLRLQTGILVATYRNPFITARAASTLDVFSNGRLTLGMGAGYLKGEYFALGVDFEQRNDLFDEHIKAMRLAWTGEEFDFEGTGYNARGSRMRPAPVQKPGIPIYIGGNAKRAIRRAVELGDGWNPFFTGNLSTATTRTQSMSGEEDLASGIQYMKEHCEKVGREEPPVVFLASIMQPGEKWDAAAVLDRIGQYKELGVIGASAHVEGNTRAEWCDNASRFAEEVLQKI
ncbi:LLM class F420-dependent oxidoreductase [Pseudomaricurvus sp. HS19]|uniref:LLM class F420-dependent oxidoreductase n=1 Tax=Pseudomaricurvus sp. HS19 TaxID=2692626 RepID=UPI0013695291|nr:LLM class F420-dependent oxidoreductase [Pseudomaricurvus sp. HS19]MYM64026.1 TIGR03619 family F420-dependent LLM class oxidoreductase [Pseudomaricurvus sp. HS19]